MGGATHASHGYKCLTALVLVRDRFSSFLFQAIHLHCTCTRTGTSHNAIQVPQRAAFLAGRSDPTRRWRQPLPPSPIRHYAGTVANTLPSPVTVDYTI